MTAESMLAIVGSLICAITLVIVLARKFPKRIKTGTYVRKWREIQRLCANPKDWAAAIIHADMLLEEVLKKRKYSGKTMGERMVNAQPAFTANDAVWTAHKLANLLRQEGEKKLSENDVKNALIGFRQALRDLGAL